MFERGGVAVLPVFLYGTLREGEANAHVLEGVRRRTERGWLRRHCLHLLEYPCAVEQSDSAAVDEATISRVAGEVVWIEDEAYGAVIDRLDRFEGYRRDDPLSSLYERVRRSIFLNSGVELDCWVYLAGLELRRRLDQTTEVASGDWTSR